MSGNIDVQYDVTDHCVTAYATNSNGDQSRSTSWLFANGGNVGICKANAAKNAIAGLPKSPTQSVSASQNSVVTNNVTNISNNYTTSNVDNSKPLNVDQNSYTKPLPVTYPNYTDGFPNTVYFAINFCSFFLTPAEEKSWYNLSKNGDDSDRNAIVHVLHGMWVTDKANNHNEPKSTTPVPDFTQWKYPEGGVKGVDVVPDFGTFMEGMIRSNSQTAPQPQRKVIPNPVTPQQPMYQTQPTRQPAIKKASSYQNYAGIIKFGAFVIYGLCFVGSMSNWVGFLNFLFFGSIVLAFVIAIAECLPRE